MVRPGCMMPKPIDSSAMSTSSRGRSVLNGRPPDRETSSTEPDQRHARLAERARQPADQPALNQDQHDADIKEEKADLLRAPAEAAIRPERESVSIPAKAVVVRKNTDNNVPERRPGKRLLRQRPAAGPARGAAMLGRQALFQDDHGEDQRDRRKQRRGKGRARQRRRARHPSPRATRRSPGQG